MKEKVDDWIRWRLKHISKKIEFTKNLHKEKIKSLKEQYSKLIGMLEGDAFTQYCEECAEIVKQMEDE